MTCVVAVTDGTTVHLAGESLISDDVGSLLLTHLSQPKVIVRRTTPMDHSDPEGMAVGLASSGDVRLRRILAAVGLDGRPDPDADADCNAWATAVAAAVSQLATEATPPIAADNGHLDGEYLIAAAGRIWQCWSDLAVRVDGYAAIGSGGPVALGAIHAAQRLGLNATDELAQMAVEAAIAHNTHCGNPIVQATVPPA